MGITELPNWGIRAFRNLEIWNFGIRKFGNLGIWEFENFPICQFRNFSPGAVPKHAHPAVEPFFGCFGSADDAFHSPATPFVTFPTSPPLGGCLYLGGVHSVDDPSFLHDLAPSRNHLPSSGYPLSGFFPETRQNPDSPPPSPEPKSSYTMPKSLEKNVPAVAGCVSGWSWGSNPPSK